jgi:hypothetical protein
MKRPWRGLGWIVFVGACAALQAAGACHGNSREQTTTEASPISAAPTPAVPVVTEDLPNASVDPSLEHGSARPFAAVDAPDPKEPLEPLMTPKHRRRPKNRPARLEATLAEGFCYDMYTVCTRKAPRRCTSAPYSLNCGVTGLLPTGDWATCVCK